MINNELKEKLFESKKRFHRVNASVSFEEKIDQIIRLQKIDTEFNKHRKSRRAGYMKVWNIAKEI